MRKVGKNGEGLLQKAMALHANIFEFSQQTLLCSRCEIPHDKWTRLRGSMRKIRTSCEDLFESLARPSAAHHMSPVDIMASDLLDNLNQCSKCRLECSNVIQKGWLDRLKGLEDTIRSGIEALYEAIDRAATRSQAHEKHSIPPAAATAGAVAAPNVSTIRLLGDK